MIPNLQPGGSADILLSSRSPLNSAHIVHAYELMLRFPTWTAWEVPTTHAKMGLYGRRCPEIACGEQQEDI